MDQMTSMATFVKVADAGGFSAAGRALNMSASMVTNHIQSLEERLVRCSATQQKHAYDQSDRGRPSLLRASPTDPD
jgi:Bacterial regulatory helix-turn-helix protein, lysR family